ncbi:hypothetical protein DKX38_004149 [Salix brachista]|uniref:Uncharacterized protein n=1 Tax=Salix brachista TaxID=2182728 RepID=A0A5N5N9D4_9ROSI|nr:hypothetical protein DKX38_004149 [Salix brachista]
MFDLGSLGFGSNCDGFLDLVIILICELLNIDRYSGDRADVVRFLQWIAICHRLLQEVCSINTLAIFEFELIEIASFELGVLSDCSVSKLDQSLHI